jgi:hypothetical protein
MLIGTGFQPSSPIAVNGFSTSYQIDNYGVVLVGSQRFPGRTSQTTTLVDASGRKAAVTWRPPAACS